MSQVLQHRLLTAVTTNKLGILTVVALILILNLLLSGQSLLKLHLLLHLLLLIRKDGMLTSRTTLALSRIVHGVVGSSHRHIHLVLRRRIIVRLGVVHQHLLVLLLLLLLHKQLLLRWVHHLVPSTGHACALKGRGRVVLGGAHLRNKHTLVLRVLEVVVLATHIRRIHITGVHGNVIVHLLLSGCGGRNHVFKALVA